MKKVIVTMLAGLLLSIGSQAQAFWVGNVQGFDGVSNYYVPGVMGLDWSSSGSGLTVGTVVNTPLVKGQTFDFLYQASLVGYTDKNGQPISDPSLDAKKYEYTIVAKLPEIVDSVIDNVPVLGGQTAFFKTQPGGTYFIYRDTTPNADVASGMGFDDGVLAAQGTINSGGFSIFSATVPGVQGVGSTILEGLVSGIGSNLFGEFFSPGEGLIFDIRFEGTLNQPALDSTVIPPGEFFVSRAGEGNYAAEPTIGPNGELWAQFKVDGSSKFSTVPEPSSILLMGAGLLGLAGFARKRVKK